MTLLILTPMQEGDMVILHRAQIHVFPEVALLRRVGKQQALPV